MKITFDNYYLDTQGTFTFIGNVDKFYESIKYGIKVQSQINSTKYQIGIIDLKKLRKNS